MKVFFRRYWPTLIVVAVILYATLTPNPAPDLDMQLIPHMDKLIHAIMFGGLCGAWYFDRTRAGLKPNTKEKLLIAGICIVAGIFNEWLQQALTENRASDIWDFAADTLGVIVAYFTAPPAIACVLRRKK